jgi:phage terminase Nu1 subunit (DNA packaging protein)
MGRKKSDDPSPAALAKRRSREKQARRAQRLADNDQSGEAADLLADSPAADTLTPPGIISPDTGPAGDLMAEQALWVKRRREITELELARRRGDLIPVVDARAQTQALGRRVRAALDRMPSHLPAHLSPEYRAECEQAMAAAVSAALATI